MSDKVLAALSVLALMAFTSIVVFFVAELDLAFVIIIVLLMACYDFWTTFARNGNNANADKG